MIKKILIAGSGVVGSEIGFYFAARGLDVVMYDISAHSLEASRSSHAEHVAIYKERGWLAEDQVGSVLSRLTYESDLSVAADDVDLVSESVTEMLEVKRATYEGLSLHCPAKTIFTTNTSTMLPSELAKFTDRPERLLACHVARPIWDRPILEIMPHAGTDIALVEQMVDFSRSVGLVPILLQKEQAAYVSNTLIAAFITTALDLVARGVASFEDVDRVWMMGTGAPMGPLGMVDMMGINTVHNALTHLVDATGREDLVPITQYLKINLLNRGKLGARSGEGFYRYPDPRYLQNSFRK
ncbi:3-hydroxyacyl-CoA dehydrogenase [Sphingobium sp. TomTYG45]